MLVRAESERSLSEVKGGRERVQGSLESLKMSEENTAVFLPSHL